VRDIKLANLTQSKAFFRLIIHMKPSNDPQKAKSQSLTYFYSDSKMIPRKYI
jgi:hypothetical protein